MPAMRRLLLFVAVLVAACSGTDDTAETFTTAVDQSDEQSTDAVSGDVTEDVEVAEPADTESADSEDTTAAPSTTEASSSLPATTAPTTVPATTRPPRTTIGPPTTVATQPTGPAKADSTTPTLAPEDTTDTDGGNAPDAEKPAEPVAPQEGQVQTVNGIVITTKIVEPRGDGEWYVCYEIEGIDDLDCGPVRTR